MERDTLGNLLFLSSLAVIGQACAADEGGPRLGRPYTSGGGEAETTDAPWTEPLGTSTTDTPDPKGETTGGEGETGDPDPDPSGAGGTGGTEPEPGGDSTGDDGAAETGTTGPMGGDDASTSTGYDAYWPCPDLAQLYVDCNPAYDYVSELDLCNQARAQAQSISLACDLAHGEYLACLSSLGCADLLGGEPQACAFQGTATQLACGG